MNTHLTYFQVIPDFDAQSANGCTCYVSNLPKGLDGLGKQPHEIDPFILRGPEIDFEGYMDLRPEVILTTARELGMMPEEEATKLALAREDALQEIDHLRDRLETLQEQYDQAMSVIADAAAYGSRDEDETPAEELLTDPNQLVLLSDGEEDYR